MRRCFFNSVIFYCNRATYFRKYGYFFRCLSDLWWGNSLFIRISNDFGDGEPKSEKHLITDYRHVTVFP
jgi:hypothetical protein